MLFDPQDVETHRTEGKVIGGVWLFSCGECSFEANYFPELCRFEVMVVGDPFVKHTCHHKEQESVRELINELDIDWGKFEVEY